MLNAPAVEGLAETPDALPAAMTRDKLLAA